MIKLSKKITSIVLASLIVSSIFTGWAHAEGIDQQFYSGNDILFYDPSATCVPGTSGSVTPGSAANPAPADFPKTVWSFLLGKGLTAEQAAGVMGNIQQESTYKGYPFNPEAEEKPGTGTGGYGIVQWTGPRRQSLNAAAAKQGVPVSSLAFQLEYLYQESNARTAKASYGGGNEWDGLKKQATIIQATVYWHDNFERSADSPEAVRTVRGGYAQKWYNEFNGKVGPGSSAGCGVADTSSLTATAKSYAWPDYRGLTIVAKPEYVTALNKARSERRYIGGISYPGIDCGGFVTTVMYDSGFEKAYNSNARGGATPAQKAWLDKNWTNLGNGASINVGDLRAGDVAMLPGHTYVYVGDKGKKPEGFDSVIASASLDERAPMAGREKITASDTTWYRKK
ncbi:MAG TPA: phage tail tip lysozyme [Candidatus Saccharimonadales bacterium]|nr:phage tail tip lysozyme [Candidatus Saccharimonadales bacterium]